MTKHIFTLIVIASFIGLSVDAKAQQAENEKPKLAISSKTSSKISSSSSEKGVPKLSTSNTKSEEEKTAEKKAADSKAKQAEDAPMLGTSSRKKKPN